MVLQALGIILVLAVVMSVAAVGSIEENLNHDASPFGKDGFMK